MAKWNFNATDNGGKKQFFTVTAPNKPEAIKKGFEKAKKNAAGDVTSWNCTLKSI